MKIRRVDSACNPVAASEGTLGIRVRVSCGAVVGVTSSHPLMIGHQGGPPTVVDENGAVVGTVLDAVLPKPLKTRAVCSALISLANPDSLPLAANPVKVKAHDPLTVATVAGNLSCIVMAVGNVSWPDPSVEAAALNGFIVQLGGGALTASDVGSPLLHSDGSWAGLLATPIDTGGLWLAMHGTLAKARAEAAMCP
jgi:hypothetical protein